MKRRKIWHRLVAWGVVKILALYFKTLRIKVFGKEQTINQLSKQKTGCTFLFWHDSILLCPLIKWTTAFHPICLLISYSRDGDLAAEIGQQYPNVTVMRVKHSSRAGALLESCKLLESGQSLFITPDGPRGPRHQIKPGALYACQKANAPIIPIVYAASRQRTLSSWDRFKIPLPFSHIAFSFLEPISCPEGEDIEEIGRKIEKRMEEEEKALTELLRKQE